MGQYNSGRNSESASLEQIRIGLGTLLLSIAIIAAGVATALDTLVVNSLYVRAVEIIAGSVTLASIMLASAGLLLCIPYHLQRLSDYLTKSAQQAITKIGGRRDD